MNLGSVMRVSTRIYLGFLVLLALFASVAFMGYRNSSVFEGRLTAYETASTNESLVAKIDSSIVDARRLVLMYINEPSAENSKAVTTALAGTKTLLEQAKARMTDDEELKKLENIMVAVRAYERKFDTLAQIVVVRSAELSAEDGVGVVGPKLQTLLSNFIQKASDQGQHAEAASASRVLEALMTTRMYTALYLGFPTDNYRDLAREWTDVINERMDEFAGLVKGRNVGNLVTEMQDGLDTYTMSLARVVAAVGRENDMVTNEMPQYAKVVADMTNTLIQGHMAELERVEKATHAGNAEQKSFTLMFTLIALAVGLVAAYFIARSITKPIHGMTKAMESLADGNLSTEIPAIGQQDEIGHMADAVQVFKDNALRVKAMEEEQAEQKRRAEEARRAAMMQLADTFEGRVGHVIDAVTAAVAQLEAASGQLSNMATETSSQAATVAAASEEATANVQTVASAADELSSAIAEIGTQVQNSTNVSEQAVAAAQSTNASIMELSGIVNEIGEVVDLINDIADQTNLLALNATIEAARAGDAGKGFAVVANEVKNLATQTGRATSEIAGQITKVQSGTSGAVKAIEGITNVIMEMSEISATIASSVEQQNAATAEIARNVEMASMGTGEVSTNIISVQQAAGETNAAASQIHSSAQSLSEQAENLKREVSSFLNQVRSDQDQVKLLEWDDELACGIAEVDEEHKHLIDVLNSAYARMMSGDSEQAVQELLHELDDLVGCHFDDEEKLMRGMNYPNYDEHREYHEKLRARYAELKGRLSRGDREAGNELFSYLGKWLRNHTFKHDKVFAEFAKANGYRGRRAA